MKKIAQALLVCWLMSLAFIPTVAAQSGAPGTATPPPQRDEAIEQEILARLAAIDPSAAPIFQDATTAMDGGDFAKAKEGYEQVLQLAPNFPDALRRLSYVETGLDHPDLALQRAREALAALDAPFNHLALAKALLFTRTRENEVEALTHARTAISALPDDVQANYVLLYAGATNTARDAIRQASEKLLSIAPDMPDAHYFAGLLAAEDGQMEKAERELLLAKKLGMSPEAVQKALDSGIAARALQQRALRWTGTAFVVWVVGLLGFLLVGMSLSQLTLTTVRRPQPSPDFQPGAVERLIRAIYRVVIAVTSVYFYVSIPFVILLVLGGAGGIIYFFLSVGSIPVQLFLIVIISAIATLIAIVHSVFTRVRVAEPGRSLARGEAPQLWLVAESVARRVGTRPIEIIYLTPGVDIAVTERGSLLTQLRGRGQRALILGLGALPGMTQGQFQAILAHEYGHFSNRDTAGGGLARQVSASIHHLAYRLASGGQAQWYNPAWFFINGFHNIFLRITLGASRLQEILADRYAALSYGAQNFADGLNHIVRQGLAFSLRADREITDASAQNRALSNLYTLPPLEASAPQLREFERKLEEVLNRPTSPYDSHPAVKDRLELVQQIQMITTVPNNLEPAWNLLPNAEALQHEMTAQVQTRLQERRR